MKRYQVRIVATSVQHLRGLGQFDLDIKQRAARQESRNRFVVPGILTTEQIAAVEAAGYEVLKVGEVPEEVEPVRSAALGESRFADGPDLPEAARRGTEYYLSADEVEDALKNLKSLAPDLVTLIELPNKTWEGRSSHAVRLGSGDASPRRGLLVTGSMHAREWGGSDICISFLTDLIGAYRSGEPLFYGADGFPGKLFTAHQIRRILRQVFIYVFPDVNPDGKHYSQTSDRWWRKNRNPNSGAVPTAMGVDLNRNFDFLWSSGIGTSTLLSSQLYKGTTAFSEPETRNVRYMFDTYPDIAYYLDIHSYSKLILYAWGDDDNQATDPSKNFLNPAWDDKRGELEDDTYREFIAPVDDIIHVGLAGRMHDSVKLVHGRCYTVQESSGLYPTTGTSTDYAFARHFMDPGKTRVRGFTIEFGEEFIPQYNEMHKIIKDVSAALTEFSWAVAAGL